MEQTCFTCEHIVINGLGWVCTNKNSNYPNCKEYVEDAERVAIVEKQNKLIRENSKNER